MTTDVIPTPGVHVDTMPDDLRREFHALRHAIARNRRCAAGVPPQSSTARGLRRLNVRLGDRLEQIIGAHVNTR